MHPLKVIFENQSDKAKTAMAATVEKHQESLKNN